jgi:hypothetical protein
MKLISIHASDLLFRLPLSLKPECPVFELVDPEPKTVVLGLEMVGVVAHYNCKDSNTQGVA